MAKPTEMQKTFPAACANGEHTGTLMRYFLQQRLAEYECLRCKQRYSLPMNETERFLYRAGAHRVMIDCRAAKR